MERRDLRQRLTATTLELAQERRWYAESQARVKAALAQFYDEFPALPDADIGHIAEAVARKILRLEGEA